MTAATTTTNPATPGDRTPTPGDRTPTRDDRMPTTREEALDQCDTEGGVVSSSEKRRAAIVWLMTRPQQGRRTDLLPPPDYEGSHEPVSIADFAAFAQHRNITGLKSETTIRFYRRWYQDGIDDGVHAPVEWGGPYIESPKEWTGWPKAPGSSENTDSPFVQAAKIIDSTINQMANFDKVLDVTGLTGEDCRRLAARLSAVEALAKSIAVIRDFIAEGPWVVLLGPKDRKAKEEALGHFGYDPRPGKDLYSPAEAKAVHEYLLAVQEQRKDAFLEAGGSILSMYGRPVAQIAPAAAEGTGT